MLAPTQLGLASFNICPQGMRPRAPGEGEGDSQPSQTFSARSWGFGTLQTYPPEPGGCCMRCSPIS